MERGEGWQAELAEAFTDSLQLLRFVEVEPRQLLGASAPLGFPVKVTRSYARRIGKGDPNDPLLLQVLPLPDEQFAAPGFTLDPVGDSQALVVPGVLHKYAGRALFVATGACAVNCRYCFRRGFPYSEQQLARSSEEAALAYIAGDESIEEVILSGGDPLLLSDRRLGGLLDTLAGIPHLRRIRLHTRVPVVLPSRITSRFVAVVSGSRLQPVVVIHANHPAE
jgi:L-lysine 2,3-aminomutase